MLENTVVITATEYADLVIKANKYDQLRKKATESRFVTTEEEIIFELTEEEIKAIEERRKAE